MKPTRHKIAAYVSSQSLSGELTPKKIEELAAYLIETGRTNELSSIMRDVNEQWAEAGVIEVQASAAHALSDSLRSEIKQIVRRHYPHAKKIVIIENLVPSLIGGVKLEFANRQLDLSIKSELVKFKQVAMSGREREKL
jgi:F0F1-type ATP synthase delta subunit